MNILNYFSNKFQKSAQGDFDIGNRTREIEKTLLRFSLEKGLYGGLEKGGETLWWTTSLDMLYMAPALRHPLIQLLASTDNTRHQIS